MQNIPQWSLHPLCGESANEEDVHGCSTILESELTQIALLACARHCAKPVLPNDLTNGGWGGGRGVANNILFLQIWKPGFIDFMKLVQGHSSTKRQG